MPRFCFAAAAPRLLARTLFLVAGLAVCSAYADDVDLRPSLVVGHYTISAYRVEKSYRRFAAPSTNAGALPPASGSATRDWFSRFLTRQVLLAHALQEGFGDRTDVRREVERMERHMLTQFDGPFYERLYAAASTTRPDLAALYARANQQYDAEILRIALDAPAAHSAQAALVTGDAAAIDAAVREMAASGQAEIARGPLSWPFANFEDVGDAIEQAPRGPWQRRAGSDLVLFRVTGVRPTGLPPADRVMAQLRDSARIAERRQLARERQQRVLGLAGFAMDWTAAAQLSDAIAAHARSAADLLTPTALGVPDRLVLARYRDTDRACEVTAADYCWSFNAQYVRSLPRSAAEVAVDTRALVTAHFDEREARASGVADSAQFREDRENYRAALALDAFENEQLRPSLRVGDEEVERAYRAQASRFTRPLRVSGRLVEFPTIGAAQAYVAQVAVQVATPAPANVGASEELVLERATPFSRLPILHELIFSGARVLPPVVGPLPLHDRYAVWISGRTVTSEITPLPEVASKLRSELEQPLLDQAETALARQLAREMRIEDHIDYARYGVPSDLPKPWNS